jgi:small subunit ribosomal protein S20
MANHKSSIKRIRQTESKKLHNRYQAKTTRSTLKKLRATTDKKEAAELLPKVTAMLDKLAKRKVIHKNKASNLKSKIAKKINSLKK